MTVLALIFLVVPIIVYDRFRVADEAQKAMLLRSVREQGRVMAQALIPLLAASDRPNLPQLGRELQRFADDITDVKLLFAPAGGASFFYIASSPQVSSAQLDAEREGLAREGILARLAETCQGELPFALRYNASAGRDEIVTSVTPVKSPAGCWAVVTSFPVDAMPGSSLGRPYWESAEVRLAAVIYLSMVLLTFTTLWSIRRGLQRFADRARAIRERRPGGSFHAQNDVPELADVAEEFDHMVEVLATSSRDIRRAAEDNAHAFKTPIAVIRQSLEPLKRVTGPENQRGVRAIGLIESSLDKLDGFVASARRLDETTADLMDMPRADVALSDLLVRLITMQADVLAHRGLTIQSRIQPKVIVNANAELLETMIENLFENAVSFSPDGKPIGVRLETRARMAELRIEDSGPGVPPENLERIFDRYFSHRPDHASGDDGEQHFGIGLWVVRRNVEILGGTVEAQNRQYGGLMMRVALPLADAARLPGSP